MKNSLSFVQNNANDGLFNTYVVWCFDPTCFDYKKVLAWFTWQFIVSDNYIVVSYRLHRLFAAIHVGSHLLDRDLGDRRRRALLSLVDVLGAEVASDAHHQHAEDDVEFGVGAEGVTVAEADRQASAPPQHVVGKCCFGGVREKCAVKSCRNDEMRASCGLVLCTSALSHAVHYWIEAHKSIEWNNNINTADLTHMYAQVNTAIQFYLRAV